jgi:hypothetical protein
MSATMHAVLSYEVEQTWCVFFLTGEFTAAQLERYVRLSRANLSRSINATILASAIVTAERPMMAGLAAAMPNGFVSQRDWLDLVARWQAALDMHTVLEEQIERDIAHCIGLAGAIG